DSGAADPYGRWVERMSALCIFLLLLFCFTYFPPRWGDWNQSSRLDLVLAIVDDHSLTIDRYAENTGDYAYFEGHYYSDKAPGTALLGVPAYAIYKLVPSPMWERFGSAFARNKELGATRAGAQLPSDMLGLMLA